MIPNRIRKQVSDYLTFASNNPYFAKKIDDIDYEVTKKLILNPEDWGLTLCTNCQNMELFIDLVSPCDTKTEWKSAIKTTVRCQKLMKEFLINTVYFDATSNEALSSPGMYTYRGYCLRYEDYEENQDGQEN